MAVINIKNLTNATNVNDNDFVILEQESGTKKTTVENITKSGTVVHFKENADVIELQKPEMVQKVNNIESEVNKSKENISELSSQLDNIANIANLQEGEFDNSTLLNKLILQGGEIQLPTNKTFKFKSTIEITNPIKIVGKDTTLVFDCDKAINVISNGFELKGVNLIQKARNHSLKNVGLFIGKSENGQYTYTQGHKLNDVNFTDFTDSIVMESVYWVEMNNVITFRDKIGFTLNQHTSSNPNPTTTLKLDRVYFKGSGNEFTPAEGSIGMKIKNVVNMSCNMVVSEWYQECANLNTIQTCTFNEPYFELCDKGVTFWNITGSIVLINPYINLLGTYGIKHGYGNVTIVGGRSILSDGVSLYSKQENSSLTIIKDIGLTGGTRFENTGYQNAGIVNIGNGIELKDSGSYKVTNQGYKETIYGNGVISTNLNDMPLNVSIGSYNLGYFTTRGLEFNNGISVTLRSPDNSTFKLSVDNNGNLSAIKI